MKVVKENNFERLLNIVSELREKCPWDKKQTIDSLRHLTMEEAYELSDAILQKNWEEIKEELGDLFLHLVFYTKIASEQDKFDIEDVLRTVCKKLIHRHPHIYGEEKLETEDQVKKNWEKLKLKEEGVKSILQGVPNSMPALLKSCRIQEKVSSVGFDWENQEEIWSKVEEEINEFKAEEQEQNKENMEQEFGDILFALVNYARFKGINPNDALQKVNHKFIKRFEYIEMKAIEKGENISNMSLKEMDKYWDDSKKQIL